MSTETGRNKIRKPAKQKDESHEVFTDAPQTAVASQTAAAPEPIKQEPTVLNHSKWIPSSENAHVLGRDIGGMIYTGDAQFAASINPLLHIVPQGEKKEINTMGDRPRYSNMEPQARATYLDWLAGGRSDPSYNAKYMLLYFYGLERRFFIDAPDMAEKLEILQEVKRLRKLYSHSHSAQVYLGAFIEFTLISMNDPTLYKPVLEHAGKDLPLSLKVTVGYCIDEGIPVPAEWMFSWLVCHPETKLRASVKHCFEEFRVLFELRFEQKYPGGLKVDKPHKQLKLVYNAASGEFSADGIPDETDKYLPDISDLKKPVDAAREIADGAIAELEEFSRHIKRNPDKRSDITANMLLPQEIRRMFHCTSVLKIRI